MPLYTFRDVRTQLVHEQMGDNPDIARETLRERLGAVHAESLVRLYGNPAGVIFKTDNNGGRTFTKKSTWRQK